MTHLAILIDKCLAQPLSEKCPPTADTNKYRDQQSNIMQSMGPWDPQP